VPGCRHRRLRRSGRGRPDPHTLPPGHGLNALTGEFGDLFDIGVIDPLRVTRLTIQHAASVAALMLTTDALVAEELVAQPGAVIVPGFGDLAEGLARPSSPV
jgi:chaperonin GroEL